MFRAEPRPIIFRRKPESVETKPLNSRRVAFRDFKSPARSWLESLMTRTILPGPANEQKNYNQVSGRKFRPASSEGRNPNRPIKGRGRAVAGWPGWRSGFNLI